MILIIILEFSVLAKVEIYTSSLCGYCSRAISLLKKKVVNFVVHDVTNDPRKRQEMTTRTGKTAVPQIFIGDKSVGGFSDLTELDIDGELDNLLGIDTDMPQ